MAGCVVFVVLGLIAVWRWGGLEFRTPPGGLQPREVMRRYAWHVTVAVVSGLGAGVLMAGAGGRLAMRLVAATSPERAQGRITEAEEVVGEITVGGTVGFIVFTGLFFGLATGVLYLVVRRWLPEGRLGGLTYGALLLIVAGTRIEPLRADNPDFDLVGPPWVSLLGFGALVLAHGMLVAALATRYASTLPLPASGPRTTVRHAPTLLLLPLISPALVVLLVGAIVVAVSQVEAFRSAGHSPKVNIAGRVLLVLVALVALPGSIETVSDIAGRGP